MAPERVHFISRPFQMRSPGRTSLRAAVDTIGVKSNALLEQAATWTLLRRAAPSMRQPRHVELVKGWRGDSSPRTVRPLTARSRGARASHFRPLARTILARVKTRTTAPLAIAREARPLPSLPPELWIYIHRLATEHVSPFRNAYREVRDPDSKAVTAPDPLDDRSVPRFLKAARSLMSVCRLWNELARELLYENVWIADTRRWASLSAALQRPDVAQHVRSLRLSTTRYDHNVEALRYCPQVEMLVQPRFWRPEYLHTAPDVPLPRLHTLKSLYWAESEWSSALLEKVLSAAPNLEHIFLISSDSTPSAGTPIEVLNLPHLKSLVLTWLNRENVYSILRTDLQHLTHLTIKPVYLEWDAVSALPALTSLALIGHPEETVVSYSTICARCPALRELRYDANFTLQPPAVGQTASALTYIQLQLWVPRRDYPTYSHFLRFFEAPAFAALERVVLKGPGWIYLAPAHVNLGAEPLRARGCRAALQRALPPTFRFLATLMCLPHRSFYTPTTDYTRVPPLDALRPSVTDLPATAGVEIGGIHSLFVRDIY
ncbi:hypothetical protein GGX14DRAFT_572907 [Mycena pura]|uniref:F-box domain-containing protein n=1 Tax=Mycena pura TaxID=153505 RepID=A0AAD6V496_9AGAR|nr:hypothetical protein GGX14DRAFT_572907 [Mycena pura]